MGDSRLFSWVRSVSGEIADRVSDSWETAGSHPDVQSPERQQTVIQSPGRQLALIQGFGL